jgi:hypothetical protein
VALSSAIWPKRARGTTGPAAPLGAPLNAVMFGQYLYGVDAPWVHVGERNQHVVMRQLAHPRQDEPAMV